MLNCFLPLRNYYALAQGNKNPERGGIREVCISKTPSRALCILRASQKPLERVYSSPGNQGSLLLGYISFWAQYYFLPFTFTLIFTLNQLLAFQRPYSFLPPPLPLPSVSLSPSSSSFLLFLFASPFSFSFSSSSSHTHLCEIFFSLKGTNLYIEKHGDSGEIWNRK